MSLTFKVGIIINKFIIVKEVINDWDPLGLLDMGEPDDEYVPEIRDVVHLLSNIKSVDELAVEIHKVFVKWFGEDLTDSIEYTIEKCYPVALKIWNKLS
ncbi:DUF1871 family protein [Salibacterium salarium]|uniref:DUF1871 family protein n=1 Tax=Salibacterium salarium TaxID=284579 RepID=A0A428MSI7_9BACI|nr:DUF1871 family protein [Salibacterium salarium]RSL28923.1 DUF1871 family protein [Salibacterium salarium]